MNVSLRPKQERNAISFRLGVIFEVKKSSSVLVLVAMPNYFVFDCILLYFFPLE